MSASAPKTETIETDLLVIGGGTGGPMAAIKAKAPAAPATPKP